MAGNYPTPPSSHMSEGDVTHDIISHSHDSEEPSHDQEEPLPQSRNIVAVAPEIETPPTDDPELVAAASKLIKNVLAKVIAQEVLRAPTDVTYNEV